VLRLSDGRDVVLAPGTTTLLVGRPARRDRKVTQLSSVIAQMNNGQGATAGCLRDRESVRCQSAGWLDQGTPARKRL
jgi:hypothetical protein